MDDPTKEKPQTVYYENDVLKKEGVNTWVPFWAVIRGKWLQFYEKYSGNERKDLRKTLEVTVETKCSLVKRKKRRFTFSINNGIGVYYIKCETELERYHWIISLLTAAIGKPKSNLPQTIPDSMVERRAVYKKAYKDKPGPNIPAPKVIAKPDDFNTNRRKKYAIRNETRMKRKELKRAKKLGITGSSGSPSSSDSPIKGYREINQHKNSPLKNELRKCKSVDVLSENTSISNRISKTAHSRKESSMKIKAMVHSPKKSSCDNNGYDDENDVEVFPTIPVVLTDTHLLPNMIISSISDSDSDEEDTADTSINSQCSRFLSLSSTDITGKTLTTQTFLSNDDDSYEQRTNDGRIIASPNIRRKTVNRPLSGSTIKSSLLTPEMPPGAVDDLLGRPTTPMKQTPLQPTASKNYSRFFVNSSNT